MRYSRSCSMLLMTLALAWTPQWAHAQGQDLAPAPPKVLDGYKAIPITLPAAFNDESFGAFRKQLAEIAQNKDRAALASIVATNFFWIPEDRDLADNQKVAVENLATAIGLDGAEALGWATLAAYAAEPTSMPDPNREVAAPASYEMSTGSLSAVFAAGLVGIVLGILALFGIHPLLLTALAIVAFGGGLVFSSSAMWLARPADPTVRCAPGSPGLDQKAAEELATATQTEASDWAYPIREAVDVRAGAKDDAQIIDKLDLHLVRVLADDSPDAPITDYTKVLTPAGKTGFVPANVLLPISGEQMCYVKDGSRWKIAGFIGGIPTE
jgi:hypothetical protein